MQTRHELVKLCGKYTIEQRRAGKLIYRCTKNNLITSAGEILACSRFNYGSAAAAPQWIAFGTNNTPASKENVALGAEIAGSRTIAASQLQLANLLQLTFNVAPAGPWTGVSEVGVLNAAAAGDLVSRSTIQPFNAVLGDTLLATWQITFFGED